MRRAATSILAIGVLITCVGCGGGGGQETGRGVTRALPLGNGNSWHLLTVGSQDNTGASAWPISVYGPVQFHGHSAYAIEDFRSSIVLFMGTSSTRIYYYGRRDLTVQQNTDEWLVPPGEIPDDVRPPEWDEQAVMVMTDAGSTYGYFVWECPGFETVDTPAGTFVDTYAIGFGVGDSPGDVPDVLLNLAPDVGIVYITSYGDLGVARKAGPPLQPRNATALERMLMSGFVDGKAIGPDGGRRYNISSRFPLHNGDLRYFVGTSSWWQSVSGPTSFAGYSDVFVLDEGLQGEQPEYWRAEAGVGIQLLGGEAATQSASRGPAHRRWVQRSAAAPRGRVPVSLDPPWELPDGMRIGEFIDYELPDQSGDIERNVLIDVWAQSVPAGAFEDCMIFLASLRTPGGREWDRVVHAYSPDVGPLRIYFPADQSGWELSYALISGVAYGNPP
jgi:hypothetical protein